MSFTPMEYNRMYIKMDLMYCTKTCLIIGALGDLCHRKALWGYK